VGPAVAQSRAGDITSSLAGTAGSPCNRGAHMRSGESPAGLSSFNNIPFDPDGESVAMLAGIAYWGTSSKPRAALLVTIAPMCYRRSNSH